MSSGKAPGSKSIPAEAYELVVHYSLGTSPRFTRLCNQENVPQEFKDTLIAHFLQMERIQADLQQPQRHLPAFHCMNNTGQNPAEQPRSTPQGRPVTRETPWIPPRPWNGRFGICCETDAQKCRELNVSLYTTFVDLTKAPDTVSHIWL